MAKKKRRIIKKLITLIIVLLILFIALCFVTPSIEETNLTAEGEILNLELPSPIDREQIVKHTGYTLSYNEKAELASYVAYELTKEEVEGQHERKDDFREDPSITTKSANLDDYKASGYDRGHLIPAADLKWSEKAMSDSFYMSNMSPQDPSFNRGIWSELEAVVRQAAVDNKKIYVVTGPVLTDGPYKTIGDNKVAVVNNFYKVLLDYTDPEIKAIGFVLPNEKGNKDLTYYAMSVDDVELITGLDFYPALDDEIENIVENTYDLNSWSFQEYRSTNTGVVNKENPIIDKLNEYFFLVKKEIFDTLNLTDLAIKIGIL